MKRWKFVGFWLALGAGGVLALFFSGATTEAGRSSRDEGRAAGADPTNPPSAATVLPAGRLPAPPPPRFRPMTLRGESHARYQTEILPQVAAVLRLSPATTAALVELDRRLGVEEDKLDSGDPATASESVSREIFELRSAYSRAKTRILGGVDAANRFSAALSDAYNGTLSVLPRPPPSPDDEFTVGFRDYGGGNQPNRYDSVFANVRGPSR